MKEREINYPDKVVEGRGPPERPVREPHGPRDRDTQRLHPSPPPPPPAAPQMLRRSAYTGGVYIGGSGTSFGMGLETQSGFFGEVDMETGMVSVGDFTTVSEMLTTGAAPRSGNVSAGVFGGSGSAAGFSGGAKSIGGSLTGPAGGVAASYSESDHPSGTEAPYKGGSLSYTIGTSPGGEVNTTRSETRTNVRESFNANLETHVKEWIGRYSNPSMFEEWR